jgi:rubrerythrin
MHRSITNSSHEPKMSMFPTSFPNCPNCHMIWLDHYAPEFCPECGAFVTDKPGRGHADIVSVIQERELNFPCSQCTKCGLKCLGTPEDWGQSGCPSCHNKLVLITNYKPSLLERLTGFLKSLT